MSTVLWATVVGVRVAVNGPVLAESFVVFPSHGALVMTRLFFVVAFAPFLKYGNGVKVVRGLYVGSALALTTVRLQDI